MQVSLKFRRRNRELRVLKPSTKGFYSALLVHEEASLLPSSESKSWIIFF